MESGNARRNQFSISRPSVSVNDITSAKRFSEMNSNNSKLFLQNIRRKSSNIMDLNHDNELARDNLCNAAIFVIMKTSRNFLENQILFGFLKNLPPLVRMLKDALSEINYEELLKNISFVLKYVFFEENDILFKYGEKGDLFYLILKGQVAVLIPKEEKMNLSEEEYFLYLLKLCEHREFEILNNCLIKNKYAYKIDYENFDEWIYSALEEEDIDVLKSPKKLFKLALSKIFSPKKKVSFSISNPEIETNRSPEKLVKKQTQIQLILYNEILRVYNIIKKEKPDEVHKATVTEYIDRIQPKIKEYWAERRSVSVWIYNLILSLEDGDKFGDFALDSFTQKRSATIISTKKSHFGTMNKKSYEDCIKDVIDKVKKANINFVLSLSIFKNSSTSLFMKNYFSFLVLKKVNWHEKLIIQGSSPENIYIIKEGEFEISMYKSTSQIDEIIKIFKNGDESHITEYEREESWKNKYQLFINEKKLNRISIIKNNDVIGLGDSLFKDKHIYNVECISTKGEVFEIKSKIFKMLCNSDPIIHNNSKEFSEKKISNLIVKLLSIKKIRMAFYQSFNNKECDINIYSTEADVKKQVKPKETFISSSNKNLVTRNISSCPKKDNANINTPPSSTMKKYSFPKFDYTFIKNSTSLKILSKGHIRTDNKSYNNTYYNNYLETDEDKDNSKTYSKLNETKFPKRNNKTVLKINNVKSSKMCKHLIKPKISTYEIIVSSGSEIKKVDSKMPNSPVVSALTFINSNLNISSSCNYLNVNENNKTVNRKNKIKSILLSSGNEQEVVSTKAKNESIISLKKVDMGNKLEEICREENNLNYINLVDSNDINEDKFNVSESKDEVIRIRQDDYLQLNKENTEYIKTYETSETNGKNESNRSNWKINNLPTNFETKRLSRNMNQTPIIKNYSTSLFERGYQSYMPSNTNTSGNILDLLDNNQTVNTSKQKNKILKNIEVKSKLFKKLPVETYYEKTNVVDCLVMDNFNRDFNTIYYYSNIFNPEPLKSNRSNSYQKEIVNRGFPNLKPIKMIPLSEIRGTNKNLKIKIINKKNKTFETSRNLVNIKARLLFEPKKKLY